MKTLFKNPVFVIIPLLLATIYLFPGAINDKILQSEISFYQWLYPAENLSNDIVVVTIGDEDVRVLGGWPISRDYYSYAIHALSQSGAKTIGLDLFFSGADQRYPRYDSTMADFISIAGNVVLPMFFTELQDSVSKNDMMSGIDPHFSLSLISQAAQRNGFSNLGSDPVIYKVPLVVSSKGNTYY
jgi:CHASE2 domain-containing sensor protein